MSLRSRINELLDSKQTEEAVRTIQRRSQEITSSDLQSIYYLIQQALDYKQADLAVAALKAFEKSPVQLDPYDFKSCIKNLLRVGTLDQGLDIMITYIEAKIIKDAKAALVYIESALEVQGFEQSFALIMKLIEKKIPLIEQFWEATIKGYLRKDGIQHAGQCLRLLEPPVLDCLRLWEEYFDRCIAGNLFEAAYETVIEVSLKSNRRTSEKWWNSLLKKASLSSSTSGYDVSRILNQINEVQLQIEDDSLLCAFSKFVKSSESDKIVPYIRLFKKDITRNLLSNLISSLIEKHLAKEALEIANLVVLEFFGQQISIESLNLNNDKLKWIVKQQQLQMIKLMRAVRQPEEEKEKVKAAPLCEEDKSKMSTDPLEEDEFMFL
ncbi:unnamed protein product [Blepharisma stoltei]|uniref:Uncharacterized protein n=1 Tax=Blepharisma stoltei TaxID=1481888 RepID=A0AAU9JE12_9CILI|nr:unnamed protein product [Blepharisma stoltei]